MGDPTGGAAVLTDRAGYDPGADLALRYPDWVLADADLGGLVTEVLCPERRIILLDRAQTHAVRRSSLAHAVAHLDLDHTHPVRGYFENREEAAANDLAARRLIPLPVYAATLSWTRAPEEVAAELGVDRATLRVREARLTKAEREVLRRLARGFAESA